MNVIGTSHPRPCDLTSLTCLSSCCGRQFERIQVLAFHVSYAHQDLMTSDTSDLTCLLCGKKWTTVRRKIMHLSLAHREIGEEHNSQCMLQLESVIAPNAPKAQRLQKARIIHDDGELRHYKEEIDVFLETDDAIAEYSYDC
uniref:C2H2-type domain-containing protein n=1 Tax=Caenorhabditis tropicalis TaxID=1561998 RepID=A0A1I7U376_9PELO